MPPGGARNRSGPPPDPNSQASERLGRKFRTLPPSGHAGKPPRFPLPDATPRERAVWRWAWTSPQAAAWATEGMWRWDMVAEWVRMKVRSEEPDSPASLITAATRLRDQIGLTPAGLKENGWTIGSAVASEVAAVAEQPATVSARDRLRVVGDHASGT